ncbi:hypothetical protein WMF45_45280 [Sorangium sp. So ce448]|uniref:hypothetical protein n=1 Tax=Sorangium sp. So ce448 TaxID=3133314 RepID=UPI003F62A49B
MNNTLDAEDELRSGRRALARSMKIGSAAEIAEAVRDVAEARKSLAQRIRRLGDLLGH